MSADERGSAPKAKWFQTWWGIGLLSVAGSVLPQLCSLIPNAVGGTVCQLTVRAVVVAFSPAPALPTALGAPPAPVVPDCPPEKRLSTGQCLP